VPGAAQGGLVKKGTGGAVKDFWADRQDNGGHGSVPFFWDKITFFWFFHK
jgi:hypothetical protein